MESDREREMSVLVAKLIRDVGFHRERERERERDSERETGTETETKRERPGGAR